ncbi:MAG: hypothetical protein M3014_12995 [Chloroflexota bacterium]|nr:hypothetical protein [Chloroflexota bacterium]
MYCTDCGTSANSTAKYCGGCGILLANKTVAHKRAIPVKAARKGSNKAPAVASCVVTPNPRPSDVAEAKAAPEVQPSWQESPESCLLGDAISADALGNDEERLLYLTDFFMEHRNDTLIQPRRHDPLQVRMPSTPLSVEELQAVLDMEVPVEVRAG